MLRVQLAQVSFNASFLFLSCDFNAPQQEKEMREDGKSPPGSETVWFAETVRLSDRLTDTVMAVSDSQIITQSQSASKFSS